LAGEPKEEDGRLNVVQHKMETFKRITSLLGRTVAILSLIFLFFRLGQHIHDIPSLTFNFWGAVSVVLAVMFSITTVVMNAYLWALLLRGGGVLLHLNQAYQIVGKSQIGKYLPGNIFQYLGRITLSRRAGISTEAAVISTGIETGLLAVTAFTLGGAGLWLDRRFLEGLMEKLGQSRVNMTFPVVMLFIILLITLIILLYPRFLAWIRPKMVYLNPRRVIKVVLLCLMVFIIHGIFISLLLSTLWGIETELSWYQFTWGFALAWVLGFITPGAPGGLGIREVMLVGLYGQRLGEGLVISLALVLRAITSLGDLLAFGLAVWLGKREGMQRSN
jgi:hypothetical protein